MRSPTFVSPPWVFLKSHTPWMYRLGLRYTWTSIKDQERCGALAMQTRISPGPFTGCKWVNLKSDERHQHSILHVEVRKVCSVPTHIALYSPANTPGEPPQSMNLNQITDLGYGHSDTHFLSISFSWRVPGERTLGYDVLHFKIPSLAYGHVALPQWFPGSDVYVKQCSLYCLCCTHIILLCYDDMTTLH